MPTNFEGNLYFILNVSFYVSREWRHWSGLPVRLLFKRRRDEIQFPDFCFHFLPLIVFGSQSKGWLRRVAIYTSKRFACHRNKIADMKIIFLFQNFFSSFISYFSFFLIFSSSSKLYLRSKFFLFFCISNLV